MMRLIYEEMMIEKDVRNFILDLGKIEISGESQKILLCREISIIFCMPEISTICQKKALAYLEKRFVHDRFTGSITFTLKV